MDTESTHIRASDIQVTYREGEERICALRDVSIDVQQGEKVAVIGPSGSGKSTLVRVLSGLVEPDDGTVDVGGEAPAVKMNRQFYSELGVVFQNHGLVPQLSALKNVLCGRLFDYGEFDWRNFSSDDRRRAIEYLRQMGLADRLDVPAAQLSGGEKQRVVLARMLLQQPSVALLDEPVSNLDIHWAAEAISALDQLGDSTMVMVAHDLELAEQWADRVVYLEAGSVVAAGEPDEIREQFETPVGEAQTSEEASSDGADPVEATGSLSGPVPELEGPETTSWQLGRMGFYAAGVIAVVGLYIWAALGVEFEISKVFGNLGNAADFIGRMLPPDLSSEVTVPVGESLVETIQMALIGTTLASVISIPLAVMAARNISPGPVRAVARVILNGLRTVPSIIWGLFFVAIVGLGPFPGILALTFYASGYLGKFYYEAIEQIDPKPLRALKTVGAGRIQLFRYGVWPQVLPLFLGYTLYMFEYNIRSASVLGIVGAGGIGFYLYTYINNFNYQKATTALLALLVVVTIIDAASSRLRKRLAKE